MSRLVRNLPAFSQFLQLLGIYNTKVLEISSISQSLGVSRPTITEYFQIALDTKIGSYLYPSHLKQTSRLRSTPKFYLFDAGLARFLAKVPKVIHGSVSYGDIFEQFIYQELRAYLSYKRKFYAELNFWRKDDKHEVDFVINHGEYLIEVKSTVKPNNDDFRGIREFVKNRPAKNKFLVCFYPGSYLTADEIMVINWQEFLSKLWGGELL